MKARLQGVINGSIMCVYWTSRFPGGAPSPCPRWARWWARSAACSPASWTAPESSIRSGNKHAKLKYKNIWHYRRRQFITKWEETLRLSFAMLYWLESAMDCSEKMTVWRTSIENRHEPSKSCAWGALTRGASTFRHRSHTNTQLSHVMSRCACRNRCIFEQLFTRN